MLVIRIVLQMQNLFNCHDQLLQITPEPICASQILEMAPEAFNRIQLGAVRRQPDDPQSIFERAQGRQRSGAAMEGSSIQHQDHLLVRIAFDQEMLQETNKPFAVLPIGDHAGNLVTVPVIGAEDMTVLLLPVSRQGDALLLSNFHPTGSQHRIQTQGRFVHKEELDFVSPDPLYSSSSLDPADGVSHVWVADIDNLSP